MKKFRISPDMSHRYYFIPDTILARRLSNFEAGDVEREHGLWPPRVLVDDQTEGGADGKGLAEAVQEPSRGKKSKLTFSRNNRFSLIES